MAGWDWLTKPKTPYTWRFFRNVLIKGLTLFVLANLVFAVLNPLPWLGRLSVYASLVPSRERLPYGSNPDQSYNLSLQNLDALFASHVVASTPKAQDEYRVLLIGDSSVWGVLLDAKDTLAGNLNAAGLHTQSGKRVRIYNLGYPIQSLAKDVLLLDYVMRYNPDLILWMVTLDSFSKGQQMASYLVLANPDPMRAIIQKYNITSMSPNDPQFITSTFWDRTIVGERRDLADLLRLQLYGEAWAETHIDQRPLGFFTPRSENFDTNVTWQKLSPQPLTRENIALDVFDAGLNIAGKIPVLVVNEPIFISSGTNADLRYDAFYPRWAYDEYRDVLASDVQAHGQFYVDLWNAISADQFTDSPVHLTPAGSRLLADKVGAALLTIELR